MNKSLSVVSLIASAVLACPPVFGQSAPSSEAVWFLNGRVFFENGSVPTDRVDIESVCDGQHRTEAQIDGKGEFSFKFGALAAPAPAEAADASNDSAADGDPFAGVPAVSAPETTPVDRRGDCLVRALLPGYRSDVIVLADFMLADKPNIGTILLHPLGNATGGIVSAASRLAPKNAQKAYTKGLDAIRNGKHEEAARNLEVAVHLYPSFAEAWFQLGVIQASLNEPAASRRSYYIGLNADPYYTPAYLKIAQLDDRARDWKALADISGQWLKVASGSDPVAYLYSSIAHFNLKDAAAAEQTAAEGIRADPEHHIPKLWYILGVLLANRGDLAGASGQFRNYLRFAPEGPDAPSVRAQLERCEELLGAAPR
jgi:tetratricopeptide (TPR) repeat protein